MDTTKQPVPMPQDRRTMAILLGAVGGCLDVFSHIQFSTLIATQTGNIILIVADWDGPTVKTAYRILSLVFFTCGFILGILLKERAQSSHWRTWGVLPLTLTTFLFPFFHSHYFIWVIMLATSTGMVMLTYTGSKIESYPYMIMMTSGNYRRMVTAWYEYIRFKDRRHIIRRQAANYSMIVASFIGGAIFTGFLTRFIHQYAIWTVTTILTIIIIHYTRYNHIHHLEQKNI